MIAGVRLHLEKPEDAVVVCHAAYGVGVADVQHADLTVGEAMTVGETRLHRLRHHLHLRHHLLPILLLPPPRLLFLSSLWVSK